MHSGKEVIYSEICHGNAHECQGDVNVIYQRLAEDRQALCMYHHSINHKGDECPCFLAVPTPVITPTHVCPDGTNEDAEPHRGEGRVEEEVT